MAKIHTKSLAVAALLLSILFFSVSVFASSQNSFYPSDLNSVNITFNSSGSNSSHSLKIEKNQVISSAILNLTGHMLSDTGVCFSGSCTAPDSGTVDTYMCSYKVQGTMNSGMSDYCTGCNSNQCTGGRNENYQFAANNSTCGVGVSCSMCWGAQNCEGEEYSCQPGDSLTAQRTGHYCRERGYKYYCNGGWAYCSSSSGYSVNVFMNWAWSSFPNNLTIDLSNNSVFEFHESNSFSGSAIISDFSDELNEVLQECNCSGCVEDEEYCYIPIIIRSDSAGILELSSFEITYNSPPSVFLTGPENNSATSEGTVKHEFYFIDVDDKTADCSLYYNGEIENSLANVQNNTISIMSGQADIEGTYDWYISCFDGVDMGHSESRQFIYDITSPEVNFLNHSDQQEYYPRNYVFIHAEAVDSNLDAVLLEWNEEVNHRMVNNHDNEYYFEVENLQDGNHSFRVYANDTAGNIGISENNWLVIDTTPPEIVSISPEDNSSRVSINEKVQITFSEEMNTNSVNSSTFYVVEKESKNILGGNISTEDNVTFTFISNQEFEYSVDYIVTIERNVQDTVGWPMENKYVFSFKTESKPTSNTDPPSGGSGGGGGGSSGNPLPQCNAVIGNLEPNETGIGACNNAEEVYISQIKVIAENEINNGIVQIIRYNTKPAHLDAPKNSFAYLSINPLNFENADIKKLEISFLMNKTWAEENGLDISKGVLYRNSGEQWDENLGKKELISSDLIIFKTELPGFSYFAIGAAEILDESENEEEKETEEQEVIVFSEEELEAEGVDSRPTMFLLLNKVKNPWLAVLLSVIFISGLFMYGFHTEKQTSQSLILLGLV